MRLFFILLTFLLVSCSDKELLLTDKILLSQGELQGFQEDNTNYYLGIPYAEPPTGALRWKPPVNHSGWDGNLLATSKPNSCMQPTGFGLGPFIGLWVEGSGMNWFSKKLLNIGANLGPFISSAEDSQSEDCLFLNIITPKDNDSKLPVMMWIHGGGHRFGDGSGSYINPDIASNDVIFVSINYRLGALGYFAHPALSEESPNKSSGNYGTLDQIQALKWISKNIDKFGGDPNNVTIFGESAGGHSVGQIMSSPLSKGLFHKAIAQSGYGVANVQKLNSEHGNINSAENSGVKYAKYLGVDGKENILELLRAIPAEDLLTVGELENDAFNELDIEISSAWHPNVDGWVFNNSVLETSRAGNSHNVPLLIGFNADEGSSLIPLFYTREAHKEDKDWIKSSWDLVFPGYNEPMPKSVKNWALNINGDSYAAAQRFWGDLTFGSVAYFAAINHSKINENTYFYYFNKSPSSPKQTIGATHGIEIMYLFNSWIPGWPRDDADNAISKQMRTDWTNFAKTGDLSISGWNKFTEDMPSQMNYEVNINQSNSSQLDLFKSIYEYLSVNGS